MTDERNRSDQVEQIRQLAAQLLAQTDNYHDLTLVHLAGLTGKSVRWLQHNVFAPPQWPTMRDAWAKERLLQAMDEVYQSAQTQEDFSARQIARVARVPEATFFRLVREEWQRRMALLSSPRERITTLIWQLVEDNLPLEHFTRNYIAEQAGVSVRGIGRWFTELYRAAYLKLQQRQLQQVSTPPSSTSTHLASGIWIDLDENAWDLRSVGLRVLKKNDLRPDIAVIAWPLLREELRVGDLAPATIATHYQAFRVAGRLLGAEVPDVRHASLGMLQRAWAAIQARLSFAAALVWDSCASLKPCLPRQVKSKKMSATNSCASLDGSKTSLRSLMMSQHHPFFLRKN
jgi:hypothetical protein